jgi:hypothetical protein
VTSSGHRHDSLGFLPLMSRLKIARRGRGRPRTRPGRVPGGKAYSSRAIRAHLRAGKIKAVIHLARGPGAGPARPRQGRRPPA